eukprot:4308745-Prymnesium_polylepis.1
MRPAVPAGARPNAPDAHCRVIMAAGRGEATALQPAHAAHRPDVPRKASSSARFQVLCQCPELHRFVGGSCEHLPPSVNLHGGHAVDVVLVPCQGQRRSSTT